MCTNKLFCRPARDLFGHGAERAAFESDSACVVPGTIRFRKYIHMPSTTVQTYSPNHSLGRVQTGRTRRQIGGDGLLHRGVLSEILLRVPRALDAASDIRAEVVLREEVEEGDRALVVAAQRIGERGRVRVELLWQVRVGNGWWPLLEKAHSHAARPRQHLRTLQACRVREPCNDRPFGLLVAAADVRDADGRLGRLVSAARAAAPSSELRKDVSELLALGPQSPCCTCHLWSEPDRRAVVCFLRVHASILVRHARVCARHAGLSGESG